MQFQRQSHTHGAASSGASRRPGAVPPAVHRSVASKVAVVARPGPSSAGNTLPVDLTSPPEWGLMGIPHYLQSLNEDEFETAWQAALAKADSSKLECLKAVYTNSLWATIRAEAEQEAAEEQLLSSFLYASILAHSTFEHSLAFVLANRLCNATMLSTQLFNTFLAILQDVDDVRLGALADLEATVERDPACTKLSHALLYYKGYHALQTQRIAHVLWGRGQKVMALALQSRISEVFAVDIHPAARLGRGILLDHGTGVVIGETAVIGNNVSLLQNITLGGTGKESGDRHPKIHDNVLIGASATILGNITIGWGAQIAAGSLVLKSVPPQTMVAGSPAREIGRVEGSPAATMKQWSARNFLQEYEKSLQSFTASIDGSTVDVGSIDTPAPRSSSSSSSSSSGLGERRLPPSPPPAPPASPTPPSAALGASSSGAQPAAPVEQPATSQRARTVDQVLASLPLEKLEASGNGSSRGAAPSNGNGASSSNGNGNGAKKKTRQQLPAGPPPSVLIQTHRGPPLEWIL